MNSPPGEWRPGVNGGDSEGEVNATFSTISNLIATETISKMILIRKQGSKEFLTKQFESDLINLV